MKPPARTCLWLAAVMLMLSSCNASGDEKVEEKKERLPECPYIDPIEDMEKWNSYDHSSCNITDFKPLLEDDPKGHAIVERGEKSYAFNIYASDKIGPRRKLEGDAFSTHKKCLDIDYSGLKLKASIIIIYHNEAFSTLVRMLNGILTYTPKNLLNEIILYDDYSDTELAIESHLRKYAELAGWDVQETIKFHKADKREGLIRAKMFAAQKANGDVLVFMDSHCEVTAGWIEPLLKAIQEDDKQIVLPVVDLIDPIKFEYTKAMIAKGTFDWALVFQWEYWPWSYFEEEENYVKPFKSVTMSGGLFAISREYFKSIGEFDAGMEIWGTENIELSIRVWLCGGQVMLTPCSRVGHVFRYRRPYSGKPGVDTQTFNALRTAEVWLDAYKKHFLAERPTARQMHVGDIRSRLELKKSLDCKPFSWFIENVHHELKRKLLEKTEL